MEDSSQSQIPEKLFLITGETFFYGLVEIFVEVVNDETTIGNHQKATHEQGIELLAMVNWPSAF